jgi:4'-phosphopantetheinyl transferase
LLAITIEREIGVDIEQIRTLPDADRIVRQFFSPAEVSEYFALAAELRTVAFFNGWTRKEAYLKATGGGLAHALDSFDVTLAPGRPPRLSRVAAQPDAAEHWSLYQVDPGPGFLGALAYRGRLIASDTSIGPDYAPRCCQH